MPINWADLFSGSVEREAIVNNSLAVGLQAYYSFEEATGIRNDLVAGNNFTTSNLPSGTGIINNGVVFDGTNYLEIDNPDAPIWNLLSSDSSISFWHKNTDTNGAFGLLSRWGSGNEGFISWAIAFTTFTGFESIYFIIGNGDANNPSSQTTLEYPVAAISEGATQHWVFTHDKATKTITLYIDGDRVGQPQSYNINSPTFESGRTVALGDIPASTQFNPLRNGSMIDELGIWNKKLTDNERNLLYNNDNGFPFEGFRSDSLTISVSSGGGADLTVTDGTTTVTKVDQLTISGGTVTDDGSGDVTLTIAGTPESIRDALQSLIEPNKLSFNAIAKSRAIANNPIDDYCLTYDLTSDSILYRPRIQQPGAGAILIPLSQSLFEITDGALSTYTPDIGTATYEDIKILTTAAAPNNQIINEQLVINTTNTGAVLDLGVSDTVITTDWIFTTGDVGCIILRADSDGNMNYLELSENAIALKSVVGDIVSTIATNAYSFTSGNTYRIEVVVIGVTYKISIDNSVAIAEILSNEFKDATKFGVGKIN